MTNTPTLSVTNLSKKFAGMAAVDDVNFELGRGELLAILGPSGSGKSTVLMCIAGLETPDGGEVSINGEKVYSSSERIFVPPQSRKIGFVPQSYALWPHMRVRDNLAYGLTVRGWQKSKIEQRLEEIVRLLGFSKSDLQKYPSQMSGGQQQRIAIGRAIAYPSEILLFDEPLSNLDAALRERMRLELKSLQRKLNLTAIYVTHDREEASALSDSMLIINEGKLIAKGTSSELHTRPPNSFAARFMGYTNKLSGKIEAVKDDALLVKVGNHLNVECPSLRDSKVGQPVQLHFSPLDVEIFENEPHSDSPNVYQARIESYGILGALAEYMIDLGEAKAYVRNPVTKVVTKDNVYVVIKKESWHVFRADTPGDGDHSA